jgi:DNA-binding transcriptional MerR regulator
MIYTIGEVAKKMNVAPSTLRYYDKEGLLPFVERSEGGIRVFSDKDFSYLSIIHCMKQTGMSIKEIKNFIDLVSQGDDSIPERLELFQNQREVVVSQIKKLQETLDILDYKCWYYETASEKGSTNYVDNMSLEEMPDKYAMIRKNMDAI